jgi:hypothetical protein
MIAGVDVEADALVETKASIGHVSIGHMNCAQALHERLA